MTEHRRAAAFPEQSRRGANGDLGRGQRALAGLGDSLAGLCSLPSCLFAVVPEDSLVLVREPLTLTSAGTVPGVLVASVE